MGARPMHACMYVFCHLERSLPPAESLDTSLRLLPISEQFIFQASTSHFHKNTGTFFFFFFQFGNVWIGVILSKGSNQP